MSHRMHWLTIPALLLIATWCLALLAAPLLAASSPSALASTIYGFFAVACHQVGDRSFHLAGYPMAVCVRCSAIYLGLLIGLVTLVVRAWRHAAPRPAPWALPAAAALILIDVGFDASGLHASTNVSRLLSGGLFGIACAGVVAGWLTGWSGNLAAPAIRSRRWAHAFSIMLMAAPGIACAAKKAKKQKVHVPKTAAAQACKGSCFRSRDVCIDTVPACVRSCDPDKPSTPYINERAACAKACEDRCQNEWLRCLRACPGAHFHDEKRQAGSAYPEEHEHSASAPAPIIIQQLAGCTSDVHCKGNRICVNSACTEPETIIVPTGGCSIDVECKGDRVCINGACALPVAPARPAVPAPTVSSREDCDACLTTCSTLRTACDQGSIKDCYRAGACMCRCRLDAGGCGSAPEALRQCISTSEAKAAGP